MTTIRLDLNCSCAYRWRQKQQINWPPWHWLTSLTTSGRRMLIALLCWAATRLQESGFRRGGTCPALEMAKLKLCLVGTELLNDERDGRVLWTLDCVVCCWFFFGLLLSGPVVGAPGFLCIFIRLVTVCFRKYMYKKRLSSLWPQANWVE